MSRGRPPQSDPLWGDSLPEEPAERKPAGHEPPDWALPAWDAVPDDPETAPAPAAAIYISSAKASFLVSWRKISGVCAIAKIKVKGKTPNDLNATHWSQVR